MAMRTTAMQFIGKKAPLFSRNDLQRRAEECQRMAETSQSDREKRSWLELSESWLRLLSDPEKSQTPAQNFQDQVDLKATQPGSEAEN
jgi:hypothetical protein